jgi:hypothetical protein
MQVNSNLSASWFSEKHFSHIGGRVAKIVFEG